MITFSNLGNMGRLGNQLFQVASTIGIAKKNDHEYCFPNWEVNKYIKKPIPTGISISPSMQSVRIKEVGCRYHDVQIAATTPLTIDLVGYFQSEKYFKDCGAVIRDYFRPSDELNEEIEEKYGCLFKDDVASIHVRGGDYRKLSGVYCGLSLEYYWKCIEKSSAKKILFFSDEIDHCKSVFGHGWEDKQFFFISERVHDQDLISNTKSAEADSPKYLKEDLLELFLMSRCRTNIVSNSTYGWWAAWLNSEADKQVFAPDVWFTQRHLNLICEDKDEQEGYLDDMIPESWQRI